MIPEMSVVSDLISIKQKLYVEFDTSNSTSDKNCRSMSEYPLIFYC